MEHHFYLKEQLTNYGYSDLGIWHNFFFWPRWSKRGWDITSCLEQLKSWTVYGKRQLSRHWTLGNEGQWFPERWKADKVIKWDLWLPQLLSKESFRPWSRKETQAEPSNLPELQRKNPRLPGAKAAEGKCTRERGKENSRAIQRFPLEYSNKYGPVHVCEKASENV